MHCHDIDIVQSFQFVEWSTKRKWITCPTWKQEPAVNYLFASKSFATVSLDTRTKELNLWCSGLHFYNSCNKKTRSVHFSELSIIVIEDQLNPFTTLYIYTYIYIYTYTVYIYIHAYSMHICDLIHSNQFTSFLDFPQFRPPLIPIPVNWINFVCDG